MVRRIGFATISALLVAQLLRVAVAHRAQSLVDLNEEVVLQGTVFYTKMMLLILSIGVVLLLKRRARLGSEGGQAKASLSTRILARTSFTFWIAIIFCGRWIAYSYNAFV